MKIKGLPPPESEVEYVWDHDGGQYIKKYGWQRILGATLACVLAGAAAIALYIGWSRHGGFSAARLVVIELMILSAFAGLAFWAITLVRGHYWVAPRGWYPDPTGVSGQVRFFDGHDWTDKCR